MTEAPVLAIGALYAGSERGLAADLLCARALGLAAFPICTSLVMASGGRVTDVTEVPVDAVRAQLEHVQGVHKPLAFKIGALADHHTAELVLNAAASFEGPVVLDIVASGPSGETVLSTRGIDVLAEHLAVATVVTVSRQDAELVTGGQIESLDDAQVAAQRIHNRGARAVVIRCGSLPYRFYDAADDPGDPTSEGSQAFSFDLCFDGTDFALFEAPLLPEPTPDSASSAFSMALLAGLLRGESLEPALQLAKRFATESVRTAFPGSAGLPRLNPFWESPTQLTED